MNNLLNETSCLSAEEIQRYLENEVDEDLRFRVENHLLDCPLCTAALEGYAGKGKPILPQAKAEWEVLRGRIADRAEIVPVRRLPWFNRAVAAAVWVTVISAGWLYWNHTRDERLFFKMFHPADSDYLAMRSAPDAPQAPELVAAIRLYEFNRFEASLPHFSAYLAESLDDFQIALYAGIAALEAGQNEQAIAWLEGVRFNDPERYAQASWYLALAHLRRGDRSECVALLEELRSAKDAEWAQKANSLLGQLPDAH